MEAIIKAVALIKRHLVLSYVVLTFAISWGGFLIAVGPTTNMSVVNIPSVAILSMALGPVVARLLQTGLVHGRAG